MIIITIMSDLQAARPAENPIFEIYTTHHGGPCRAYSDMSCSNEVRSYRMLRTGCKLARAIC